MNLPSFRLTSAALLTAFVALTPVVSPSARAADWPQWRGADRKDHSPDTGLLKEWPTGGPKRLWLNEDVGMGYAGYSIAESRLFTMGLRGEQEYLIAVDANTGKQLWAAPAGAKYSNGWGDGPRMTPTLDGERVYGLGGSGLVVCANAKDGHIFWQKSLVTDLGGKLQSWGYTESPIIVGDVLLLTPGGGEGTMAGLDKKTGEIRWRSKDLTDEAQYSSPIAVKVGGKVQVVQLVKKRFFGVDPSNGEVLWKQDFPGNVAVIPTPIAGPDGQIYITSEYGAGCQSVRIAADGKTVTPLYANKVMKNHHGGVVLVGEHLYGYSEGRGWTCQNLKTGNEVWASKRLGKGAIHYADGMLYCLDEKSGEIALVEASPTKTWNEKGRFTLSPQSTRRHPKGGVWPHPVVVNGHLYLRDQELLYCFDVKAK